MFIDCHSDSFKIEISQDNKVLLVINSVGLFLYQIENQKLLKKQKFSANITAAKMIQGDDKSMERVEFIFGDSEGNLHHSEIQEGFLKHNFHTIKSNFLDSIILNIEVFQIYKKKNLTA